MIAVHVYQSALTGHWLVDKHGTRQCPGDCRVGYRKQADALTEAWAVVQQSPSLYNDVVVQR